MFAGVAILIAISAMFDIDQTVRAQGQVISGSRTQVIQAADGGVLTAIHVHEGDHVKAGQKLAELEADRARAGESQSRAEVASKRIALIRAHAELTDQAPVFGRQFAEYADFVAAQMGVYRQRKQSLDEDLAMSMKALRLSEEELAMNERLLSSGDISRTEVMRSQRQVLELQARIAAARNKYLQDARQELARIEDELSSSRFKLDERRSVLEHTDLTAPTDGVVKLVRVTTVGGVLRPGDELMQISPSDDELLVEIKVNPVDIGQLVTNLPVALRFDAFDSSLYGKVNGTLRYLSPDTLTEAGPNGQQQTFYRAQVALDWRRSVNSSPRVGQLQPADIKPGMTATADVLVGRRTLLYFLAKPIVKAFSGALTQR